MNPIFHNMILAFLIVFIPLIIGFLLTSSRRYDFELIMSTEDPEKRRSLWIEYKKKYKVDEENRKLMKQFGIE